MKAEEEHEEQSAEGLGSALVQTGQWSFHGGLFGLKGGKINKMSSHLGSKLQIVQKNYRALKIKILCALLTVLVSKHSAQSGIRWREYF